MTLVEVMIGSSLGVMIAGLLVSFSLFSSRSLLAMSNHLELGMEARGALDRMTKEIRKATGVTAYATNSITLSEVDGSTLVFSYNPAQRRLTRTKNGNSTTLLNECSSLSFAMFMRETQSGTYDLMPTTNPALCKAIKLTWTCERSFVNASIHSQDTSSATIVLRMK